MASAANTSPAQDGSTLEPARPPVRPNPVALEVAVVATGTRPSDAPGQRDLFTEETTTVLVFRDGAVIRLNAGVALGQLVFLTHKQTKREVVCQVLRKRALGPTGFYVELDFTEEIGDFWGVAFPVEQVVQPKKKHVAPTAAVAAAEELVKSAGTSSGEVHPIPPEPSLQEVDQLREEVELLRQQLQSLLQVQEPSQVPVTGRTEGPETQGTESPAWAKAVTDAMLSGVAQRNQKTEIMSTSEPVPEAQESSNSLGTTGSAETSPSAQRAPFAAEEKAIAKIESVNADELLPKPALDFSKAPKTTDSKAGASSSKSGARNSVIVKVAAVILILAAGSAVAWYENLLPFSPRTKAVATVPPARQTVQKDAATLRSGGAAVTSANSTGKLSDAATANGKPDEAAATKPSEAAPGSVIGTDIQDDTTTPATAEAKKSTSTGREKKSLRDVANDAPETELPESAMNDSGVAPAKLLKSVNAVYPPDAMRNYITGDVIIDALVHADGKVGEMKIVTGPTALRGAATDALKQYQYAPATQGGKPVASHVKVTVKFWFNP